MSKTEDKKTYIYNVGDKDILRLQLLNDIYNPLSQQTLLDINLRGKKCVIDMACGQGMMTCWMAKQIMPHGIVIGIDYSDEQLELAKQRAEKQGLENVQFIKKSV